MKCLFNSLTNFIISVCQLNEKRAYPIHFKAFCFRDPKPDGRGSVWALYNANYFERMQCRKLKKLIQY